MYSCQVKGQLKCTLKLFRDIVNEIIMLWKFAVAAVPPEAAIYTVLFA
jgi:hypothetical protein